MKSNKKNLFLRQKVWKNSEKVWKVRKMFGKSSEISEIRNFRTFRKLRKNDVQLKIRKSRKTHSDLKTDSKVRLKVRNAGPYWTFIFTLVRRIGRRQIKDVQQIKTYCTITPKKSS